MKADDRKREYESPKVDVLGSLTELTRGDGVLNVPSSDSAQYNSTPSSTS
jgi:hypothetical protein